MVGDAGGAFFLVHVATPLEECERRDRKGMYAKARAGLIPEFTGISSPYEEPKDADVRVDTTGRTIEDALDDVLVALRDAGYLDLTGAREAETAELPPDVEPVPLVEPEADPPPQDPGLDILEPEPPLRVLYICTANICRSPFLELLSRHLAGPDAGAVFASAGTRGFDARPMAPEMAETLTARGVSGVAQFRSRLFSSDLMPDADLVLTVEAAHRQFILDDHPASFRKVFTLGQFAESVRGLDRDLSGRSLLEAVAARRGPADPTLDITDPYGLGPEAAEAAAVTLEDLLRVVVPALTGTRKIPA